MTRSRSVRITSCALLLGLAGLTGACSTDSAAQGSGSSTGESAAEATSEPTSTDSGAGAPDPCTLITNADLEASFGLPFGPGEPNLSQAPFTFHGCGFEGTTDDLVARSVTVQTLAAGDIDEELDRTVEQVFDNMRTGFNSSEAVEGIGDEAFTYNGGLAFIQDGVYVDIAAPGGESPEARAGVEQLARTLSAAL